jgi:hypothetical protein
VIDLGPEGGAEIFAWGLPEDIVKARRRNSEAYSASLGADAREGSAPVHMVWGIRKDSQGPAVLVTAYRPDPLLWSPFHETQDAMRRTRVELVREGKYAAEVSVELIEEEGGWSPYLSLDDARKLDSVKLALRRGDIAEASKYGRLFELMPVSA